MTSKTLVLILVASMVVAQLVSCMPAPALTPVPPTATPIPTATATAPAVENVQARAWVSHSQPGWGSVQTVFVLLTQGGQGVANAQMYIIVHDNDADRRWPSEGFEITGDDGIASTSFTVVENPEGVLVNIDIYLSYKGSDYQAHASFVPYC